jgi:hypothetical protein
VFPKKLLIVRDANVVIVDERRGDGKKDDPLFLFVYFLAKKVRV